MFQENSKEEIPALSWAAEGCSQSPEQPPHLQLINKDTCRWGQLLAPAACVTEGHRSSWP